MDRARIVIKRDGTVTLNREPVGVVIPCVRPRRLQPAAPVGWIFESARPMGPCGGTFTKSTRADIVRELYRRLAAPLSGR